MKIHPHKGFTLVEAVIAITLLAIVGVIIVNMIYVTYNIRNTNKERQEALKIATSAMDEIKAYQGTWKDLSGLQAWLAVNGYSQPLANTFKLVKTVGTTNFELTLILRSDTSITGLFEVELQTTSPRVTHLSITTRFRG
ncbi:MAG: prepilin-type N-terminal cleavage/methylation domain-containing protein [Clostridia bacterium]|nr:prepilin-type N-terminal cleavage/methylation domain-containing protein [Clostridia bacterium]